LVGDIGNSGIVLNFVARGGLQRWLIRRLIFCGLVRAHLWLRHIVRTVDNRRVRRSWGLVRILGGRLIRDIEFFGGRTGWLHGPVLAHIKSDFSGDNRFIGWFLDFRFRRRRLIWNW
jgi:hypothetical protein